MSVSPTEYILVSLAHTLTQKPHSDLRTIKRGLTVAAECAKQANDSEEFKSLMTLRATQLHNVPEEELLKIFSD